MCSNLQEKGHGMRMAQNWDTLSSLGKSSRTSQVCVEDHLIIRWVTWERHSRETKTSRLKRRIFHRIVCTSSAGATVIKCPSLRTLSSIYFLHSSVSWKLTSRVPAGWFLVRTLILACRHSAYILPSFFPVFAENGCSWYRPRLPRTLVLLDPPLWQHFT